MPGWHVHRIGPPGPPGAAPEEDQAADLSSRPISEVSAHSEIAAPLGIPAGHSQDAPASGVGSAAGYLWRPRFERLARMSAHEMVRRASDILRCPEAWKRKRNRPSALTWRAAAIAARRLHQIEQELAWPTANGTAPVTPRPELKRRTRRVERWVPGPRRSFAPLLALAASLVLAVGAWAWATSRVRSAERATEVAAAGLSRRLEMARDTLEIMRTADRVRHARRTRG